MGLLLILTIQNFLTQVLPKKKVSEHRKVASQIRKTSTIKEVDVNESQSGYCYSALLNLPYIDICRMLVDPIHDFFKGTGKASNETYLYMPSVDF